MEGMDVWEPNSAIQPQAVSWAAYPLDGYEPMLDEGVGEGDKTMGAKAEELFFENCDVKLENATYDAMGASYATDMATQSDPMGWCYAGDESLSSVMSPTSESDDTMRYGNVNAHHESGDETTPSLEDTSSEEEEELHYAEHMAGGIEGGAQGDMEKRPISIDLSYATPLSKPGYESSSVNSIPFVGSSPSGRPVRSSARGEQMKQVQEMIRQVNSAVEAGSPPTKQTKPYSNNSSPSHNANSPGSSPSSSSGSNSKKRARVEPDLKSVTLSREQLLTMTSEELDVFTERLKSDHALTAHEMRELKRQRRLIKNREYAQASRVKKKVVLSDLGVKFNELESERNALAARVQVLEIENTELRRQLGLDASKRNLNQFIIGSGAPSSTNTSNSGFFSYKSANGAQAQNPFTIPYKTDSTSETSQTDGGDYLLQPPKAKRARGRQGTAATSHTGPSVPSSFSSRAAVIGGGMSLFAIVLLAIAVFNGAGSPFFNSPIGSPAGVPAMSNYPPQAAEKLQAGFKSDSGYNTWRTMDILATTPDEDNPISLDPSANLPSPNPSDTIKSHVYQPSKDESTLKGKSELEEAQEVASPAATIVSMDDLMASEDMVFSTTNVSVPEEHILDDPIIQQQQQA